MRVLLYLYVCVCMCVCIFQNMYMCVRVYVYMYVCVYVYVLYVYMYDTRNSETQLNKCSVRWGQYSNSKVITSELLFNLQVILYNNV